MKTSQQEYLDKLEEIQNGTKVDLAPLPVDEPRFIIDSDTREITIPEEIHFLAVKNDNNAETFYFEIDRYFDIVDLSTKTCVVQFLSIDTTKPTEGIYPVRIMDIESIDGKIILGWTIENSVTKYATSISFSIRFYSIADNKYTYCWNTLPQTMEILPTLNTAQTVDETIEDTRAGLLSAWIDKLNSIAMEAEASAAEAEKYKDDIWKSTPEGFSELVDTVNESKTMIEDIESRTMVFHTNSGELTIPLSIISQD